MNGGVEWSEVSGSGVLLPLLRHARDEAGIWWLGCAVNWMARIYNEKWSEIAIEYEKAKEKNELKRKNEDKNDTCYIIIMNWCYLLLYDFNQTNYNFILVHIQSHLMALHPIPTAISTLDFMWMEISLN